MAQTQRWQFTDQAPPANWQLSGGSLPPELVQILQARGIKDAAAAEAFLSPEQYLPALPSELPDLERAVDLLNEAIDRPGSKVLVWGDFDVDGQTATSILVEGLRHLAVKVDFYIPDRQRESHGLHLKSLQPLLEQKQPQILLVCDTGSSDVEAVAYAKTAGITVLIADHHELPPVLPAADALVNPARLSQAHHPLRTLSGAGVAYLLIQALYDARSRGREARNYLDLVALGLVADIVELVRDTRYLAQLGLRALRKTSRPGLLAICQQLQLNPSSLTETDISFKIAPLLNALGRLDSASKGVELLMTRDPVRAQLLTSEANGLNRQRQMLTDQMSQSAQEQIERDPTLLDWESLVLMSPNWHSGIVGIVAARLAEQYHKPVALLVTDENGAARGSIRSVPGYHVGNALAQLDDILTNYGGHEGAGGLGIDADHLPLLRRRLSQAFASMREALPTPTLTIDAVIPLERLTLDFIYQIQRLAPFGSGNPAPIFMTEDLKLASVARLGNKEQHRRLTVQDKEGHRQTVFWWGSAGQDLPDGRFNLAYKLALSVYQDAPELQAILEDWQQIEAPAIDPIKRAEIIDCRPPSAAVHGQSESIFKPILATVLQKEPQALVWAEGYPASQSPGKSLSELAPAEALVVFTAPAANDLLITAIQTVQPHRVYFIAAPPPVGTLNGFQQVLNGLLNTVMEQHHGETTVMRLRERLAVTNLIVELGLETIATQRGLTITFGGRGRVIIEHENHAGEATRERLQRKLDNAWQELQAFRHYLRRVPVENLLD